MDTLWSPWRVRYVSREKAPAGCVFCGMASEPENDAESFILWRGRLAYVVLNRFPYSTGHLMVVPYAHVATLSDLDDACLSEMMILARLAEQALRNVYRPGGFNIGLNLGECAGAGIAAHLHLHVLPRWTGDANFMTTIGETRVIPEDLPETWRKLRIQFESSVGTHHPDHGHANPGSVESPSTEPVERADD